MIVIAKAVVAYTEGGLHKLDTYIDVNSVTVGDAEGAQGVLRIIKHGEFDVVYAAHAWDKCRTEDNQ